jgi:hypothetical protein
LLLLEKSCFSLGRETRGWGQGKQMEMLMGINMIEVVYGEEDRKNNRGNGFHHGILYACMEISQRNKINIH